MEPREPRALRKGIFTLALMYGLISLACNAPKPQSQAPAVDIQPTSPSKPLVIPTATAVAPQNLPTIAPIATNSVINEQSILASDPIEAIALNQMDVLRILGEFAQLPERDFAYYLRILPHNEGYIYPGFRPEFSHAILANHQQILQDNIEFGDYLQLRNYDVTKLNNGKFYVFDPHQTDTRVMLHWSASSDPTALGLARNMTNTQAGAHFAVGLSIDRTAGEVAQLLPMSANSITVPQSGDARIDIEIAGSDFDHTPPNEKVIAELTGLLMDLMQAYNIPFQNIVGHFELSPTARKEDPGRLFMNNIRVSLFNEIVESGRTDLLTIEDILFYELEWTTAQGHTFLVTQENAGNIGGMAAFATQTMLDIYLDPNLSQSGKEFIEARVADYLAQGN